MDTIIIVIFAMHRTQIFHDYYTNQSSILIITIALKSPLRNRQSQINGTINSNNANYYAIIMMSKPKAPFHGRKKPIHTLPNHKSSKPSSLKYFFIYFIQRTEHPTTI